MMNQTHMAVGIATLVGSLAIGFSMERGGVRSLDEAQRKHFLQVKRKTRVFRSIALGMLATYLVVKFVFRDASPDWNHASVLCLWTSYNVVLWVKMRRVMKAFQTEGLPMNFQVSYLFSQIICYTGLVSSMLVLLRGRIL